MDSVVLSRRAVLQGGALLVASSVTSLNRLLEATETAPSARIGLVTDVHHADKPAAGTRFYRDSLKKLEDACATFAREKPQCVVELGDFIDSADTLDREKEYLRQACAVFSGVTNRRCVLGNHCVSALTKQEFLEITEQEKTYDSFDLGGFHFVMLDACYRKDGIDYGRNNFTWTDANLPAKELDWLRSDLQQTDKKSVVFVHQRLDEGPPYGLGNSAEVRRVLEDSGKVLAVFQGHYHPGDYRELGGIAYCTLSAVIEGSGGENGACSILEVRADHSLRLKGFRRQRSHEFTPRFNR